MSNAARSLGTLPIVWMKPLEESYHETKSWAHLIGTIQIAGVDHHIEAFAVEERQGCQESVLESHETNFDELSEIVQGSMQTVEIDGREYVILVTPFQD